MELKWRCDDLDEIALWLWRCGASSVGSSILVVGVFTSEQVAANSATNSTTQRIFEETRI